jgi:hypothetical protein
MQDCAGKMGSFILFQIGTEPSSGSEFNISYFLEELTFGRRRWANQSRFVQLH